MKGRRRGAELEEEDQGVVRAHRAAALCELKQHECGLLPKLQPMRISKSIPNLSMYCFVSLCNLCVVIV